MIFNSIKIWLGDLLKRRGINPDGRFLFAYDLSESEYKELGRELSEAISAAGGVKVLAERSLGHCRLCAPPAAFVLYASEWWKREYTGGAWGWSPIIESLGADPLAFEHFPQLRSQFVTLGLSFWKLNPLDKGRAFIGAVVVNGGIPMRLLAQGEGRVSLMLNQVLKQASRYHWGRVQILNTVSERLNDLPSSYRRLQIAELLATFVDATLQLKEEYQLEGVSDPVARLDGALPDWRRRFPVSLESEAAKSLLTGLVREAAAQSSGSTHGLFVAERRLIQDVVTGLYFLESHFACTNRISTQVLASLFGLHDESQVPRYFTLDLEAEVRQPFIEGRLVLGAADPVAVLTTKKMFVRNQAARSELQLIMRSQDGDKGERCTIEGGSALPDEDPWIFVDGDAGYPVLAAVGGARLPHDSAWVALAPGWSVEDPSKAEPVGELHCPGLPVRKLVRVRDDARLLIAGVSFRIRLRQQTQPGQIYQWKGLRLPEGRGRSVFRSSSLPRLFRVTEQGLQPVPSAEQHWHRSGAPEKLLSSKALGPVEVRILDEGELLARQRIFLLPAEARIEYISGSPAGVSQVRFLNWGDVELAPETPTYVTARLRTEGLSSIIIDLTTVVGAVPPSEFRVYVRWPGANAELMLNLYYPVSGGRFVRADGSVMQNNETVTLRELVGMRIQIFDNNPSQPKRYELQLAGGHGKNQISVRYPLSIPLGVGRAEIRLLDYQPQIESLLGFFDHLDTKVRVGLLMGGGDSSEIQVGRYTTMLEVDEDSILVPEAALGAIPTDWLEEAQILACPLTYPDVSPLELVPVRSEGVHTGGWAAKGLSADLAPWFVYPAPESRVLFRPLVWAQNSTPDAQPPFSANDTTIEVASLSDAMSQADPSIRKSWMHSALVAMSENHQHDSWPLLDSLWQTFDHLPLTALDVWRMLAKQPKAVLSFLLRSELNEASLAEAIKRLHSETAWLPELTTVSDLCEAAQAFWRFWAGQGLDRERCQKYFKAELESRFNLLANEIPSLGPLIETVVFAATGTVSDTLLKVGVSSTKMTKELLIQLWDGPESLVNSQLFLPNADRDISHWPGKDFLAKHAWPAFAQACSKPNEKLLGPYFQKLFWPQAQDRKFSVANLPVLCALWAATSTSRKWWSNTSSRLAFKQIRDFDPIWFEQAYRQAFKVCMSIDGVVQLPVISRN